MSPAGTKNSRHKVLCQQDRHLQPRPGKKTERNKHCQTDNQEQQIRKLSILNKIRNKRGKQEQDNRKKWAEFKYVERETRYVTKLFKNTDVKVTRYKQQSRKTFSLKTDQKSDKYDWSGLYQLECPTCNKKYIGQTGEHSE
jgi:hypothetical protein